MRTRTFGKRLAVWLTAAALSAGFAVTAWASTRLDTVENTYWDEDNDTVARWDEVEEAYQYEIYLYRDESRVATVKTKKNYYNMEKKFTSEGEYTFKVRALAKSSSRDYRDGYWSKLSDSIYISEDYAELNKSGGKIDTDNSGPGATGGTSGQPKKDTSVVYTPQWMQDNNGWWYRLSDGTWPHSGWWQDPANSTWYYFNDQGYMVTGWVDYNGARYYCLPSGAMVTGDTTIDGVVYHFDASGALQAS